MKSLLSFAMCALTGAGIIGSIVVWLTLILLGGWLWPYTIEFWAKVVHHVIIVPFWVGAILGLIPVIRWFMVPLAIVTWLAGFIIVIQ